MVAVVSPSQDGMSPVVHSIERNRPEMTLNLLADLLRGHLAALQSSAWPQPQGASSGPALYLDAAETQALIAELARVQRQLAAARASEAEFHGGERMKVPIFSSLS